MTENRYFTQEVGSSESSAVFKPQCARLEFRERVVVLRKCI